MYDGCCVCFFLSFFLPLFPVPLNKDYQCIETHMFLLKMYLKSHISVHYSVDFLEKGRVFDLKYSLQTLSYFIHIKQTPRSGLSFQLGDLLSLFFIINVTWLFYDNQIKQVFEFLINNKVLIKLLQENYATPGVATNGKRSGKV